MVIGTVSSTAVDEADSFRELLPAAGFAIVAGVKAAVTPAGKPVTVRLTTLENPFVTVVATATRTLLFLASDAAVEPAVRVKDAPGATVTGTTAVSVRLPLVPLIVIE